MSKRFILLSMVLVLSLAAAVAGAHEVPADKEVIKIDVVPGKKGSVAFQHKKHVTEYKAADGSAITCKTCHHTLKEDLPADPKMVKACTSCHVLEGNEQVGVDGKTAPFLAAKKGDGFDQKSVIFHDSCVDCHTKVKDKKIGSCNTCH
jgi:hypothetical protein